MPTNICKECGSSFESLTSHRKTCSDECRIKRIYRSVDKEKKSASRKAEYWKDPEKYRAKAIEWRKNNPSRKKKLDTEHKDKIRHGGLKAKLIEEFGLVCSSCGVTGNTFDIVAHHVTGNPAEHESQVLLCRACHASIHHIGTGSPARAKRQAYFREWYRKNKANQPTGGGVLTRGAAPIHV